MLLGTGAICCAAGGERCQTGFVYRPFTLTRHGLSHVVYMSTDYEYHRCMTVSVADEVAGPADPRPLARLRWWYPVGAGVAALWMPRWVQIPVLAWVSRPHLNREQRARPVNTLAWLFLAAAFWYEFFVWLFPITNELTRRWDLHPWFGFALSTVVVAMLGELVWFFAFGATSILARWFWKWWWHRNGLANPGRMAEWEAAEWDREFQYAHRRYQLAADKNQKRERSLDMFALLETARHHGFVQRGEDSNFETLENLRVTQSGLDYVNSSAYVLEMTGMIGLYFKPDSAFYDLLLATTALHLSGVDPASCGRAAFQKFMEENIQVIRAVIDRLKESHPAISMSEEAWERARRQTRTAS